MREHKIIVTGAVGAGKTTAIAALSDVAPVNTDVVSTDRSMTKPHTTVGLDFGEFALPNGDTVRLFGTPGQARFDFLWDILARNALGVIVLCDNARQDPLADLQLYIDGFALALKTLPCVVGVGRCDTHDTPSLDDHAALLQRNGHVFPVVAVDVRRRADVVFLVDLLLLQLEADVMGDAS